jgi:hypothetical protein
MFVKQNDVENGIFIIFLFIYGCCVGVGIGFDIIYEYPDTPQSIHPTGVLVGVGVGVFVGVGVVVLVGVGVVVFVGVGVGVGHIICNLNKQSAQSSILVKVGLLN